MTRESRAYPRVLVINGEPFHPRSATGLTLTNLFRGWPRERLATLYRANFAPDLFLCDRTWKLGLRDLAGLPPQVKPAAPLRRSDGRTQRAQGLGSSWKVRLGVGGMRVLRSWLDQWPYRITPALDRWIADFRPDLVYSLLGSKNIMTLVESVARRHGLPVVPHFMDDWPAALYHGLPHGWLLRRILQPQVIRLMRQAPAVLVISDAMAAEYQQRYGQAGLPFMNCVELEPLPSIPEPPISSDGVVRFTYIGGLHLHRWQLLREIGLSLARLRHQGVRGELLIHTKPDDAQRHAAALTLPPVMRMAGYLAPADVPETLSASTCLVHVESFDRSTRAYTRLSISTKIPEYLAAQRPILAYGPASLASIRYVATAQAGLAVGRHDPALLAGSLWKLIADAAGRRRMGLQGRQTAITRHNAVAERERFRAVLARAAGVHRA